MKAKIILLLLLMLSPAFADEAIKISELCQNNRTLEVNYTYAATGVGSVPVLTNFTSIVTCQYGCDNASGGLNQCNPDPTKTDGALIPVLVLFFVSLLLLYAGINMKDFQQLQILFFGLALFLMIVQVWYAQEIAVSSVSVDVGNVFRSIYLGMTAILTFVIFYMFVRILVRAIEEAKVRKREV